MSDPLSSVTYHAEDHLPGEAVVLVDSRPDGSVHVYMSDAYPLPVIAAHLGAALDVYRERYGIERRLSIAG